MANTMRHALSNVAANSRRMNSPIPVLIVGYEVAHESVKASNRHLAGWFRTGAVALIAFDGYTDIQYGNLASGFWGQVAFAGVTAFIVAFFGVIGFRLLEHAVTEWSR
jgi:hypothetical protein